MPDDDILQLLAANIADLVTVAHAAKRVRC